MGQIIGIGVENMAMEEQSVGQRKATELIFEGPAHIGHFPCLTVYCSNRGRGVTVIPVL